jgi:hypothetical protein
MIVAAPLIVVALVSGSDIVQAIDTVRRSRVDELREHSHDALKQVDAALV